MRVSPPLSEACSCIGKLRSYLPVKFIVRLADRFSRSDHLFEFQHCSPDADFTSYLPIWSEVMYENRSSNVVYTSRIPVTAGVLGPSMVIILDMGVFEWQSSGSSFLGDWLDIFLLNLDSQWKRTGCIFSTAGQTSPLFPLSLVYASGH